MQRDGQVLARCGLELESEKLEEASAFAEKNRAKGADYINDALVSSGLSCS